MILGLVPASGSSASSQLLFCQVRGRLPPFCEGHKSQARAKGVLFSEAGSATCVTDCVIKCSQLSNQEVALRNLYKSHLHFLLQWFQKFGTLVPASWVV